MTEKTTKAEENRVAADCPNERLVMLQKSLQTLRDMTQVQCNDGNWNYDPYMHGMANGMIFALSLFEAGEPQYLEAPEKWLKDLPEPDKALDYSRSNNLQASPLRSYTEPNLTKD